MAGYHLIPVKSQARPREQRLAPEPRNRMLRRDQVRDRHVTHQKLNQVANLKPLTEIDE